MHRLSRPLALLLLLAGAQAAKSKDIGTFPSVDGAWTMTLAADPDLTVNHLTSLTAKVAAKDPTKAPPLSAPQLTVRMPVHGHGMVVRPKTTEVGPGDFRIDGVKLHMAGEWEMTFSLTAGGQPVMFVVPVKV